MRGDKLGSVDQAVSPSHLHSRSFGWGPVSDAVEVLRETFHGSELNAHNPQTEMDACV